MITTFGSAFGSLATAPVVALAQLTPAQITAALVILAYGVAGILLVNIVSRQHRSTPQVPAGSGDDFRKAA